MFVVPEMLTRARCDDDVADARQLTATSRRAAGHGGALAPSRHAAARPLLGIGVGVMPGLGASIAVWLSYGHAARTEKSEIPYGQGAIAGVIAPEAANNSKEGGAMVPTLFFGIPGSSGMAIMMAAFRRRAVGPRCSPGIGSPTAGLRRRAANLIAIPLFFLAVPLIAASPAVRRGFAPFAVWSP